MIDIQKTVMDGRMERNGGRKHSRCQILHFCCHRLSKVNECAQKSWNKNSAYRTVSNAGLAEHKPEILRSECLQLQDIKTRWWPLHTVKALHQMKLTGSRGNRQTSGLF
jgi:hypothetical protein